MLIEHKVNGGNLERVSPFLLESRSRDDKLLDFPHALLDHVGFRNFLVRSSECRTVDNDCDCKSFDRIATANGRSRFRGELEIRQFLAFPVLVARLLPIAGRLLALWNVALRAQSRGSAIVL